MTLIPPQNKVVKVLFSLHEMFTPIDNIFERIKDNDQSYVEWFKEDLEFFTNDKQGIVIIVDFSFSSSNEIILVEYTIDGGNNWIEFKPNELKSTKKIRLYSGGFSKFNIRTAYTVKIKNLFIGES